MPEEDEWVEVAMSQDKLVVDMLLKLKQGRNNQPKLSLLRFNWTVRQRRSKPKTSRACSPTTPLSWSANTTSPSAGPDDSTRPLHHPISKVVLASNKPTIKRSRKKKTLAELREEENMLLKERINLNEQLITLRLNVEKHKAENSSLKKLKLDLLSRPTVEKLPASIVREGPKLNQSQQMMKPSDPSCFVLSTSVACNKLHLSSTITQGTPSPQLPDLNIPADEDYSCSSLLCGLS